MTTQTCGAVLVSEDQVFAFTLTCTDDQFNTMKDSINTLNLYEVAKGRLITKGFGYYTAGSGVFRVRNTSTQKVKAMFLGTMVKGIGGGGDAVEKFDQPFVVEDNDILEVYCTVAGS